jgi:hypothetical protein
VNPPQASLVCPLTKKRFKTRAAYDNHVKSKKYGLLLAKAAGEGQRDAPTLAAAARAVAAAGASPEPEAVPAVAAAAVAAVASVSGCSSASCSSAGELAEASAEQAGRPNVAPARGTAGEAGEESDGWVDEEEEPWVARWGESLFDTHVGHSLEANVRYMQRAHSFFVPDTDSCALVDTAGLFRYLQEKVCRHHTCLFCNRPFGSAEACRDHMRDKAHCRLNLETEGAALELSEFYSFAGRLAGGARRGAPSDDDGLVGTVVAGMLPNGQRLGHRSLRQFYRQSRSFTRLYSHTGTGRIGMRKAAQQKAKADCDAAAKEVVAAAATAEAVAATEVAAAAAAEAGAAEARARAARGGGERGATGGLRWSAAGPSSVRISLAPAAPQGEEAAAPAAEACARGREATEATEAETVRRGCVSRSSRALRHGPASRRPPLAARAARPAACSEICRPASVLCWCPLPRLCGRDALCRAPPATSAGWKRRRGRSGQRRRRRRPWPRPRWRPPRERPPMRRRRRQRLRRRRLGWRRRVVVSRPRSRSGRRPRGGTAPWRGGRLRGPRAPSGRATAAWPRLAARRRLALESGRLGGRGRGRGGAARAAGAAGGLCGVAGWPACACQRAHAAPALSTPSSGPLSHSHSLSLSLSLSLLARSRAQRLPRGTRRPSPRRTRAGRVSNRRARLARPGRSRDVASVRGQ